MRLTELTALFDKNKIPYCVVGGYAVALHGVPRGTIDIDFLTSLTEKSLTQLENVLKNVGYVSRIPVSAQDIARFRIEFIKNKNLIAWSFVHNKNPIDVIDILITIDITEVQIEKIKVGNQKINIISLLDLIKMKKQAGRRQDLEDVRHLEVIKNEKKKS